MTSGIDPSVLDLSDEDDDLDLFDAEEELAALNDDEMEHLPEPPLVGGSAGPEEVFGEMAQPVIGIASSPKLFAQASVFPQVTQLRVWKMENGVPVGLGAIDATATEEDFCHQFLTAMPQPGEGRAQFKMRPIDINMREVGQQFTVVISEHHSALTRIRRSSGGGGNGVNISALYGMGTGGAMRLAERNLEMAERRAQNYEGQLGEERRSLQDERSRMAQERVDLASNSANALHAVMERALEDSDQRASRSLEAESSRNAAMLQAMNTMNAQSQEVSQTGSSAMLQMLQQSSTQQMQFMQAQQDASQHRWENQMREENERRSREREETDRRWREREVEIERKREGERLDSERREREREGERHRRHELAMEELKQQRERDREHTQTMLALQTQRVALQAGAQSGSDLESLIDKGSALATKFGYEPSELLERLIGGGDDGSSGPSFVEVLPKLVGVVGEVMKKGMEAQNAQAALPPPSPSYLMPPPPMPPEMLGNPVEEAVPEQPEAPEPEEDEAQDYPHNLPLAVLKPARKVARKLIRDLRGVGEGEYVDLILQAISMELHLLTYLEATSIAHVAREAGASPEEVTHIVARVDESGLVSESIKRL